MFGASMPECEAMEDAGVEEFALIESLTNGTGVRACIDVRAAPDAPRHLAQTPLTRDCRAPALVAGAGRAVVRADPGGEQGNRYPGQPPPRTVLDLHQLSAAPLALARRLPPLLPSYRGELHR